MTLYHYTDQNGFMGIVLNQELWASKIQYLNDEREYTLALDLASLRLRELIASSSDRALKTRLGYYLKITPYIQNMNICVCSLTENGDLLSQWRGYSRGLAGYSIGFNEYAIEPFIRLNGFELVKCIYEPDMQRKKVYELIDAVIKEFSHEPEPDYKAEPHYPSGDVFLERLAKIAPILKDSSFSEEAEWRVISQVDFEQLEFRAGKSTLTPYFKISLDCKKDRDFDRLIDEIIVGHTPHPELAVSATEAFILKHFPPVYSDDYKCPVDVKKSAIPYRDW